jgi:peptidoglycan L-alanyl-D-glutamate endopeptidase CwlK
MPKLDARALRNLDRVHPDLVRVMHAAIELTAVDFTITEGVRSLERQRQLVARGASQTLRSRHLLAPNGFAHAVDVAARIGGTIRWDWPLYERIAVAVKRAAADCNVPVEWGGDWRSFRDGPHYQLPWDRYPG